MVTVTFEPDGEGNTFAHIVSTSGVLGHAKEIRERVPSGTYLTMPSKLARLTPWMVKKCRFRYVARLFQNHEVVEVLIKE